MSNTKTVIPVIHYLDNSQAMRNAEMVFDAGCDNVMLINMNGPGLALIPVCEDIKTKYPEKRLGVNFLDTVKPDELPFNIIPYLNMTWTDCQLTYSLQSDYGLAKDIMNLLEERENHQLFCAAAFKYQQHEPNPIQAAGKALDFGFIPTTSGSTTGVPADPSFVRTLREGINSESPLAIASGVTPDNAHLFLPYVSHILVSTGISESFYEFDKVKLKDLLEVTNSFRRPFNDNQT